MEEGANLTHIDERDEYLIVKGMFFKLSPFTLPLCLFVLLQNAVLFLDYYQEKSKLVSTFFMGIALADILKAQAETVLSIICILVYTGHCSIQVLYRSFIYYILTGWPGANCSKVFNLTLTLTLTFNLVNPFHRLDTDKIKRIAVGVCSAVTFLHFVDAGLILLFRFVLFKDYNVPLYMLDVAFYIIMSVSQFPGVSLIAVLLCYQNHTGKARCGYSDWVFEVLAGIGGLYLLLPPVITLICLVIQIKYIRRNRRNSSELPRSYRHATGTVVMVSTLYFLCSIAYLVTLLFFAVFFKRKFKFAPETPDEEFVKLGIVQGLAEFTLPLIYAAVFPVILAWRKPALRKRYWRALARLASCCVLLQSTANNTT